MDSALGLDSARCDPLLALERGEGRLTAGAEPT